MKKQHAVLTVVLFCTICLALASFSYAWIYGNKLIEPDLSFSAGGPDDYLLYKITWSDDTSSHVAEPVDTVGTDGFSISDLQLGKITDLSGLERSNYVYYAVRIPKTDGEKVSIGVSYGSSNEHFEIHVPVKVDGEIQPNEGNTMEFCLFEDAAVLASIAKIETDNEATFLSYSCAFSDKAPTYYQNNTEALETLFADEDVKSMNELTETGDPLPHTYSVDTADIDGDYYYAYIKIEPNLSLYKYFVEYLWDNMPFLLAYRVRVTLEVAP